MAKIDYDAVRAAIRDRVSDQVPSATVRVEENLQWGAEVVPYVGVYLDRRTAPDDRQALSAGTTTRYLIEFVLWVVHFHFSSPREAVKFRDDALGDVEVALIGDRTLGGLVNYLWLTGGELLDMKDSSGFVAMGELGVTVDATMTT